MISYTKAVLPYNKHEYTIVIVYGLSEEKPMKLLTNLKFAEKEDVIKIVRMYLSRWRIEEHFRGKKQAHFILHSQGASFNYAYNHILVLISICKAKFISLLPIFFTKYRNSNKYQTNNLLL